MIFYLLAYPALGVPALLLILGGLFTAADRVSRARLKARQPQAERSRVRPFTQALQTAASYSFAAPAMALRPSPSEATSEEEVESAIKALRDRLRESD